MKAFELLDFTDVKITKTTPRKELHGDEKVQAISLRLLWTTTQAALDKLHPGLLHALFWRADEGAQGELDDVPQILPNLRCALIEQPLKLKFEVTGYTVTIDRGIDEDSQVELYGCTLSKFQVEAKEGGSVELSWSIGSNEKVTPEVVGLLCDMEGSEMPVRMKAPEKPAPAIDGTVEAFRRDHPEAEDTTGALDFDGPGDEDDQADSEGGDADVDDDAGPALAEEKPARRRRKPRTPEEALAESVGGEA